MPQDLTAAPVHPELSDVEHGYAVFVAIVAKHCTCVRGPCHGVLAGGLCDGFDEEWEERQRRDGYGVDVG